MTPVTFLLNLELIPGPLSIYEPLCERILGCRATIAKIVLGLRGTLFFVWLAICGRRNAPTYNSGEHNDRQ